MTSMNLYVEVMGGQVKVTDQANNSPVTEDQVFTEHINETITLWQGAGATISELRISGKTPSDWPGTSHLRRSTTPGQLRNSNGNPLLGVKFENDRVVLTDLNATASAFNYKFGISIQYGGVSYDWDPVVREEPPSMR